MAISYLHCLPSEFQKDAMKQYGDKCKCNITYRTVTIFIPEYVCTIYSNNINDVILCWDKESVLTNLKTPVN